MSKDEFTKLFMYMTEKFDQLDAKFSGEFAKVWERFDRQDQILDQMIKSWEVNEQERLVMSRQLTRHDKWINALADKIGHKLSA